MVKIKRNIAVVGCGYWGKNLVRNYAEIGALAAVCDPNTDVAKFFANEYDVAHFNFSEVLTNKDIDGVVLAVPAELHASLAIDVMNAKKHVFVEKPLAMNVSEANLMIETAKKNNVQLMVGHLLQYHPIFVKLKEIVKSGKLGHLNYIYSNRLSFGKIRTEEDVVWSFAPHDISMILSLTEEEPQTVKTSSSCIIQPNIADTSILHLDFKSQCSAHVFVSWLHPCKEQKLVVIGNKGMAIFDDTQVWENKLSIYPHTINSLKELPTITKGEKNYIRVKQSEPLKNECNHFIEVVCKGRAPLTDFNEGLKVLKVLSASSLSSIQNKSVKIKDL